LTPPRQVECVAEPASDGAGLPVPYAEIQRDFGWQTPATFNFGSDVVDRWAREADGVALISTDAEGGRRTWLFSEIAHFTDRLGAALRASGIAKGDRVIVMLPRSAEWMIAMVGVLKIGAIPVPCVEMLTPRDLAYRIANCEPAAVICRAAHTVKFSGIEALPSTRFAVGGAPGWTDWDTAIAGAPSALTPAVVAAEDPAIMYYTSGSTGLPKGVLHAARALHAWRWSALHWLDLRPSDLMWCTADTGWSKAGTSILFGPWSRGAAVFLHEGPFVPRDRLRLLADNGVTVYCAPGAELYRVSAEDMSGFDLSRLRRTVSAGEAVSPAIAARWESATGVRIDEAYGQTETLMLAMNVPGELVRYGSMGRPAPGCRMSVIDEEGRPLAAGQEGDLALLTPNPQLMVGYWRDPARTAACFRAGPQGLWYVTGDRASADADGYLWFRGRADDVINSAGYRIGPVEVENVLMEHPAVAACAVVGARDPERGEIVKAFVVLQQGHEPGEDLKRELQQHAKALTAPYKYPRAVEFIDALPLTPTGKVRRQELRRRDEGSLEQET